MHGVTTAVFRDFHAKAFSISRCNMLRDSTCLYQLLSRTTRGVTEHVIQDHFHRQLRAIAHRHAHKRDLIDGGAQPRALDELLVDHRTQESRATIAETAAATVLGSSMEILGFGVFPVLLVV